MKGGSICLTQKLMTSSFFKQTAVIKLLALEITDLLKPCQDNATEVPIAPMAYECEREIWNTEKQ